MGFWVQTMSTNFLSAITDGINIVHDSQDHCGHAKDDLLECVVRGRRGRGRISCCSDVSLRVAGAPVRRSTTSVTEM